MRSSLLVGLALSLVIACHKKGNDAGDSSQVLAKIDQRVITVGDLERHIQKQPPFARARYSSPESKRQLLDHMVRFEVMAREAEKRGYHGDSGVAELRKQHMINRLVQREFDAQLKVDDVPEAEAKRYYEEHPAEFSRDEEVRISQILVKDKGRAAKVEAEARALAPADERGFRDLVAKHSEDESSKSRGGDLMFLDRRTLVHPKALVEAAFAIEEVNGVSPVVETEKGFHVLRLTQRRPALSRPFADVKREIRTRLLQEKRAKRMDEWVAEMRKQIKVEVFEDRLKEVRVAPTVGS